MPTILPGAKVGMRLGLGARVVPERKPGTHLGFRQHGSSGSDTKVHSGGRSWKLGHLKEKHVSDSSLVSVDQSFFMWDWHVSLRFS